MQKDCQFTEEDWHYVRVFLVAMKMDGTKFLIILSLFAILGLTGEFLFTALVFLLIRKRMGGVHCKSYQSCLAASTMLFVNAVILFPMIFRLSKVQYMVLLFLCAVLGWICKPVINKTRPAPGKGKVIRNKILVSLVLCLLAVYAILTDYGSYAAAGLWIVVEHTVLLSLANIKWRGGEMHYVFV